MATHNTYRTLIETTLRTYTTIPYAYGDLQTEAVFDRENDHYLVITIGWDEGLRIHTCIIHIDLVGEKVWIQRDNTESGIARELVAAGIPKDHIVLGFRPPEVRSLTEYAVA